MGPLPGQKLKSIPQGETCDECDNPATTHMVGEVDSFGYETIALCDQHYEEHRNTPNEGECDLCGTMDTLTYSRDPEEIGGRPDALCTMCHRRRMNRAAEDFDDEPSWD